MKQIPNKNELIQAKTYFNKILQKNPYNTDALRNLSIICIKQNQIVEAEVYLKDFLSLTFDQPMMQNFLQVLSIQKKWDELINNAKNLISEKRYNQNILIIYAMALRESGEFNKAKKIFIKLISEFPNYIQGYISYGYSLNANGFFSEAIKVFQKGLGIEKNSFDLNYNLGLAFNNLNDYQNATKYLKIASEINPNYFDLWMTIAVSYNKLQDYKSSDEALTNCNQLMPNSHLVAFQKAGIYRSRENLIDAEKFFYQALKITPDDIETHVEMAITKLMLGKFKEAVNYYRYRVLRNEKYGIFNDFNLPEISKNDPIIIAYEQGIGDQLIYFRLMPEFLNYYKDVTYICLDKTYSIFSNLIKNIKVIKESDYLENNKNYENGYKKINLGSILNYIPDIEKALHQVNNINFNSYKNFNDKRKKLRIGISWRSTNQKMENYKNLTLNELSPLFGFNDVSYVSIQYGDVKKELDEFNKSIKNKISYDPKIDLYNELDASVKLIANCDLIITTSNLNAHLAGTLNVPTILFTPYGYGKLWYWYDDNKISRWYSSVEFMKQDENYSWENAIHKVQKKISVLMKNH
jgi:tetratricopeptide (TPR) repeat protein